ncbi:MAG: SPASM domain-containing protein [Nitrospirae bacterium]|nr:SPASM domain-containing protein [Nitrospirota bacterium]
MIEPTNVCNLECPTCPTGSGVMNRPKRMMSYDEFKGIIDQVRGYAHRIVLWNYGEPFLNKELVPMIRYAADSGIFVETSTNGEFFRSGEFCNSIVKSRLQKLIVCLDGADQETISKFRRGSHFKKIIEGIKLMADAKKALKSVTPEIEFQFIVMKHNEHQKAYMKELAEELGVDIYCEKTVGVDSSDPDFQNLAKELLPGDLSLSRFVRKRDGTFALKGEITNYCWRIFQSVVINSDGSVVPCCYDLYSRHVMGNVFEESLENIWRNKRYNRFRRQLLMDRKAISMCNICSEGRSEIRKRDDIK